MRMTLVSNRAVWSKEKIEENLSEYLLIFGVNFIGFQRHGVVICYHYTTTILTAGLAANAGMSVRSYVKKLIVDFEDMYNAS